MRYTSYLYNAGENRVPSKENVPHLLAKCCITRSVVLAELAKHGLSPTPKRSEAEILATFKQASSIGRKWLRTIDRKSISRSELSQIIALIERGSRSILLKGEPGCGKTRLAGAVAYELGLPFEAWYIKSTTQAKDGLYTYDAVTRLRDAQLAAAGRIIKDEDIPRISDPATYVQWGALGRAFQNSQRTVVLIDEIDKADIDFPNDLLLELDQQKFIVDETQKEITAKAAPIVFITSNDEKDLPDAFLRRCLFHYVEFPDPERLIEIINSHFPASNQQLVAQAVIRFLKLRGEMGKDKGEAGKKVTTSELIDWFRVLKRYPEDEVLAKLNGKLPYAGVLLKSWQDHVRYLKKS